MARVQDDGVCMQLTFQLALIVLEVMTLSFDTVRRKEQDAAHSQVRRCLPSWLAMGVSVIAIDRLTTFDSIIVSYST